MLAMRCIAIGITLGVSSCVGMLAMEDTWQKQSFAQRYGGSIVRILLGGLLLTIGFALTDWQAVRHLLDG